MPKACRSERRASFGSVCRLGPRQRGEDGEDAAPVGVGDEAGTPPVHNVGEHLPFPLGVRKVERAHRWRHHREP